MRIIINCYELIVSGSPVGECVYGANNLILMGRVANWGEKSVANSPILAEQQPVSPRLN